MKTDGPSAEDVAKDVGQSRATLDRVLAEHTE